MDAIPLVHTRMARNMPHKNTKNIIPASTPAPFIPKIIPKRQFLHPVLLFKTPPRPMPKKNGNRQMCEHQLVCLSSAPDSTTHRLL